MTKKNTSQLSIQKFLITSPRKSSLSKQDNTPTASTSNTSNKTLLSKKMNKHEKSKFRNAVLSPKLKLKSGKKKRLSKEEKKKKKYSNSQQLSLLSFFSPAYHLFKKISSPFKNEKNERTNPTDSAIEMDYKMSSNLKNTQNEEIGNEDYQMVDNDIEEEDVDDYEEYEEFDPFDFIRSLPPLEPYKEPILPPKSDDGPEITLVLDLDETLVHCTTAEMEDYDVMFPVELNGQQFQVSGRYRPYCAEFLEKAAEMFEIIIFTASQKVYANTLLDFMDPTHKLISYRLFRDECVTVYGNYLKDLSVLGRDLSKTIIIDNSIYAFGYQLENGIPITSWYSDRNDRELLCVLEFLQTLIGAYDVRPYLKEKYKLIDRANASYNRYINETSNNDSSSSVPTTPIKTTNPTTSTTTASFITSSPKQKSPILYNK
jgi:CTD small phosphatase-like protein 2